MKEATTQQKRIGEVFDGAVMQLTDSPTKKLSGTWKRINGEHWVTHRKRKHLGILRAHWANVSHVLCEVHPEEVLLCLKRVHLRPSVPPHNASSRPLCEWVSPPCWLEDHIYS